MINKKTFFAFLAAGMIGMPVQAEVLLTADFEGWQDFESQGWTEQHLDGTVESKLWKFTSESAAIAGKKSVSAGAFTACDVLCDNWLISPVVDLSDASSDYKVDLLWGKASFSFAIEYDLYDFQIAVRVVGEEKWNTVFSFSDPDQVEASGVHYPWSNWSVNHSIVDISAFAGQKVQIGFLYHEKEYRIDNFTGNSIEIDDITVESYVALTGPIAECATTRYIFPETYIGTYSISDEIVVKNVGIDLLQVTGIEGLEGTNFSSDIDMEKIAVKKNDSFTFHLFYTPTMTGAASTSFVLHTNGGDVKIALSGSKKLLPADYSYEGFEQAGFPPVGWSRQGSAWNALNSSFSGAWCAWGTAVWEPDCYLTSPRLDLSAEGDYYVSFDYYEQYNNLNENGYNTPDTYFEAYFSTDGGTTWTEAFANTTYNKRVRYTYEIKNPQSDNCYFRFAIHTDFDTENADDYEYSNVFLDDIVLPPLYGRNNAPATVAEGLPADGATDVINREVKLQWSEVQFAEKYKVYLGTSATDFNVLNGEETTATSYQLPRLECATTYFWKVVAVNANGESKNPNVWQFTTAEDQTVREYPYFEGFEHDGKLPLGWMTSNDGSNTRWQMSNVSAFDGRYKAFASGNMNNTSAQLVSTEFVLDDDTQISFYWGNGTILSKDELGSSKNTSTVADGNDAAYFDVYVDDAWIQLGMISMNSEYWVREVFDLSAYAGKTIALRWRYELTYGNGRRGISLDNVRLESANGVMAFFNTDSWSAGKVNYKQKWSSADKLSLVNGGLETLTVAGVAFATDNFSANLEAGVKIAANVAAPFSITFDALETSAEVNDTLVVTFQNGQQVKLPVSGNALASDMLYFNFDSDEHGSLKPSGLTVVDVDRCRNYGSMAIDYPHEGEAFAFIVLNIDGNHADWRNVYPVSGDQVLAAMAPYSGDSGEDWVISPKLAATANSKFSFYGKSYATDDEFNDFTPHYFQVLVSTTDTKTSSFTSVKNRTALAYSKEGKFTQYTIDLSKYAGKEVYVALKHTVASTGYVAFFDDFEYAHFTDASSATGIEEVVAQLPASSGIFNMQGQRVEQMQRGELYIVKGRKVYQK